MTQSFVASQLSNTVEEKRHDKKLADEKGYEFSAGSQLWKIKFLRKLAFEKLGCVAEAMNGL
jgi:hypothetical protein